MTFKQIQEFIQREATREQLLLIEKMIGERLKKQFENEFAKVILERIKNICS